MLKVSRAAVCVGPPRCAAAPRAPAPRAPAPLVVVEGGILRSKAARIGKFDEEKEEDIYIVGDVIGRGWRSERGVGEGWGERWEEKG